MCKIIHFFHFRQIDAGFFRFGEGIKNAFPTIVPRKSHFSPAKEGFRRMLDTPKVV